MNNLQPGSFMAHASIQLEPTCQRCGFPHEDDVTCRKNIERQHRAAMEKLPEDQRQLIRKLNEKMAPNIKRTPRQKENDSEAERQAQYYGAEHPADCECFWCSADEDPNEKDEQ